MGEEGKIAICPECGGEATVTAEFERNGEKIRMWIHKGYNTYCSRFNWPEYPDSGGLRSQVVLMKTREEAEEMRRKKRDRNRSFGGSGALTPW